MTADARYVLFLNPDTEIREGTFAALVRRLDELPDVGLAGVVQLTPDGEVYPTIRRFRMRYRRSATALEASASPSAGHGSGNASLDPGGTRARPRATGRRDPS